jgi:branched-chain amino acid transport system substrate-binding protein
MAMISPTNTYPGLTKPGRGEVGEPDIYYPTGKRNYARVIPTDELGGRAAANWARDLGAKTIYLLHDNDFYGKGLADIFSAKAKTLGLEVKGYEGIDAKAQEYTTLAAKITQINPDLVYYGGLIQHSHPDLILKALRAAGYQGKFMGGDGLYIKDFLELSGPAAEGSYIVWGGVAIEHLSDKAQRWRNAFKQKYQEEPYPNAMYAYEATSVLMAAINKICAKDRPAIRDALLATRDFDGILGQWSFDENGDITIAPMNGSVVKNGKFEFAQVLNGN